MVKKQMSRRQFAEKEITQEIYQSGYRSQENRMPPIHEIKTIPDLQICFRRCRVETAPMRAAPS